MRYGFGLLLCCVITGSLAQIYKWKDKNGQVHYSQTPPAGQAAAPVDLRESQPGDLPSFKTAAPAASAASTPASASSVPAVPKKSQATVPKSLSGGRSDDSDASRCNFARDILRGAVKPAGRRGPIDDNDLAVAQNDVQMFCR